MLFWAWVQYESLYDALLSLAPILLVANAY